MKKTTVKKLLALLLVSLIFVSIAACGGNNGDTTASSSANASGEASANTGGGNTSGGGESTSGGNSGGGSSSGGASSGRDTITIALTQDSGTLDPLYITGTDMLYSLLNMIYEPLWKLDQSGNIVWMLATSCEFLEPLRWIVHLREGVVYSNGDPLEAEDVLFALIRTKSRVGEPDMFPQLDAENSKVIDTHTVELVFSEYEVNLVRRVASHSIINRRAYEADPSSVARAPIGTGPYVMESYVINSHLNLTLRTDGTYWGELPRTKNFRFVQMQEDAQRVNALQTGEVDGARVPTQDIEYVQSMPSVNLNLTPSSFTTALYFNISSNSPSAAFFDNTDARLAVAYAIDRDAILRLVYNNYGQKSRMPAPDNLIDIDDRFLDLGIYGDDYKPDLARDLAISSGLAEKNILLINNGSSPYVLLCELIQANLKDIGVTCTVNNLDMGSWTTVLFDETQFDMKIDGVNGMGGRAAGAYNFSFGVLGARSYSILHDYPYPGADRVRELYPTLLMVEDEKQLLEMNYELTQYLVEGMMWYGLVDQVTTWAFSVDLKGDAKDQLGGYTFWSNLYFE